MIFQTNFHVIANFQKNKDVQTLNLFLFLFVLSTFKLKYQQFHPERLSHKTKSTLYMSSDAYCISGTNDQNETQQKKVKCIQE